jgi:transcriptional regulator GlxA family with amidase domain
MIPAMVIYILVLDGVFDMGLAALTDVIGTARELVHRDDESIQLDVRLVGVRKTVRTAQGLTVPVVMARDLVVPDFVLVPALGTKMPGPLMEALHRKDVADAQVQLRRWSQAGAMLGAACTGTFVLEQSGLLDGQTATTSWWLSGLFRQHYPHVHLEESKMLVNSGRFTTAGAALAHLDLGLGVVRSCSPSLAALSARYLLIESRASQAEFLIPDHVAHSDPIVERFEQWARARLANGFSMSDAARSTGASERTLGRRLQLALGKSPLAYFQDLRVERAIHLLQTSNASVDQIAEQVGYSDATTLRNLLRSKLGRGVRELRRRPG